MRIRLIPFMLAAAFLMICGCRSVSTAEASTDVVEPRSSNVFCVVVGMLKSSKFPTCTGADVDSSRMYSMFTGRYGYSGVLLQNEKATKANVVSSIKDAVSKTPEDGMFVLYYSGHGGQEMLTRWNTTEPDGYDKEDEYLCLYDTFMLDDEVWSLIRTCKGRVFLCFDCCHSQTMYRSSYVSVKDEYAAEHGLARPESSEKEMVHPTSFSMRKYAGLAVPLGEKSEISMLCWSGCQEKEYSFGSSNGGVMTNAILAYNNGSLTWDELWKIVYERVTRIQKTQHPCSTGYGDSFKGKKAFR